jgi:hypothetical protein
VEYISTGEKYCNKKVYFKWDAASNSFTISKYKGIKKLN